MVSVPPAAPRVRGALEEVQAPAKEAVETVEAPVVLVAAEAVGAPEAEEEDNLQDLLFYYL